MPQSPPETPAITMSLTMSGAMVPPYFCASSGMTTSHTGRPGDAVQRNQVRVVGDHEHVIAQNGDATVRAE